MNDLLFPLTGIIPKFDRNKDTGEFIITFDVTSTHNDETAEEIFNMGSECQKFVLIPEKDYGKLLNQKINKGKEEKMGHGNEKVIYAGAMEYQGKEPIWLILVCPFCGKSHTVVKEGSVNRAKCHKHGDLFHIKEIPEAKWDEDTLKEGINIKVVNGLMGNALYIKDYRVAGPKPYGGRNVYVEMNVPKGELLKALGMD